MSEIETKPLAPPSPLWAWSTWGLAAALYLTGFYQRVAPAVMTAELMADFQVTAVGLGGLSGFYFYAYVLMQIPTGLLTDSLGPRKVLFGGALVATLGTFLFGIAPGFGWAGLGRALIGGSVGVAYVAGLKLALHWLPANRFAFVSGLGLVFGVVGATAAGPPLRFLVGAFGWRPVMLLTAALTLALALAIWWLIRDDPEDRGFSSHAPAGAKARKALNNPLAGLGQVLKIRNILLLLGVTSGIGGPMLAFCGLWGVPFLKVRYGLSAESAAFVTSLMMITWAVGGPLAGIVSERLKSRNGVYIPCAVLAALGWAVLILLPGLPLPAFAAVAALVGLFSGTSVLSFAIGKESAPARRAGTALSVINTGSMCGPMLLQPLVGLILDLRWSGQTVAGVRVYSLADYQVAFGPVLIWAGLACLLIGLTRETHCRPQS